MTVCACCFICFFLHLCVSAMHLCLHAAHRQPDSARTKLLISQVALQIGRANHANQRFEMSLSKSLLPSCCRHQDAYTRQVLLSQQLVPPCEGLHQYLHTMHSCKLLKTVHSCRALDTMHICKLLNSVCSGRFVNAVHSCRCCLHGWGAVWG